MSAGIHIDKLLDRPAYLARKKAEILSSYYTVPTDNCWYWTGSTNDRDRAITTVFCRQHNAARVVYIAFSNKPIGDLHVCHSCDNVLCVNPDHLWLGTCKDNMQDKVNKGRQRDQNGSKHNLAVLSESDIDRIKRLRKGGFKLKDIAEMYNVTFQHISAILTGKKWKHL